MFLSHAIMLAVKEETIQNILFRLTMAPRKTLWQMAFSSLQAPVHKLHSALAHHFDG